MLGVFVYVGFFIFFFFVRAFFLNRPYFVDSSAFVLSVKIQTHSSSCCDYDVKTQSSDSAAVGSAQQFLGDEEYNKRFDYNVIFTP